MLYGLKNIFWLKLKLLSALTAILFFLSSVVNADEEYETYDGILVENAHIDPARSAAGLRLKLKIYNQTSDDLTLTGIETDRFKEVKFILNLPNNRNVEIDALSILREETLELDSSHISIELRKLTRAIKPGEIVKFNLLFSDRIVPIEADLHPVKS